MPSIHPPPTTKYYLMHLDVLETQPGLSYPSQSLSTSPSSPDPRTPKPHATTWSPPTPTRRGALQTRARPKPLTRKIPRRIGQLQHLQTTFLHVPESWMADGEEDMDVLLRTFSSSRLVSSSALNPFPVPNLAVSSSLSPLHLTYGSDSTHYTVTKNAAQRSRKRGDIGCIGVISQPRLVG